MIIVLINRIRDSYSLGGLKHQTVETINETVCQLKRELRKCLKSYHFKMGVTSIIHRQIQQNQMRFINWLFP